MTEEKAEQIVLEAQTRFNACQLAEAVMKYNGLGDALFYGYKPPTRFQRFKYKLKNMKQRAKDIWTIISGGDIHKDCGY